jgi:hypothetical protein
MNFIVLLHIEGQYIRSNFINIEEQAQINLIFFMYRPNVGAGLLVVQTIKYLHFSDEKITK